MIFWKKFFFSSRKNIRNSQKVLLDLDHKYKKITQKNFLFPNSNTDFPSEKKPSKNEKDEIKHKQILQNKIRNLENPQRQKHYYKENSDSIPFYDEKELQKRIFNCKSSDRLFSLYNGHKFTFSIKNIITTFTVYEKLIKASKLNKLPSDDKRLISLIYNAEENIDQMNNIEKTLLCKSDFLILLIRNNFKSVDPDKIGNQREHFGVFAQKYTRVDRLLEFQAFVSTNMVSS